MNNKKITITIGIPAYNEEANIGHLLHDLLKQKTHAYQLDKIIVSSDASTDKTEEIVRNYKDKKIILLSSKKREGLASRENQIIKNTSSEYLLLINADTRVFDENFLDKIIEQMEKNHVDLGSPKLTEITPSGFFENILMTSMKIKTHMFEHYRNGNNVYTCHGQARIFSKKIYKKFKFISGIGDDAYSYFYCMQNGYRYLHMKNAIAFYKLPGTLDDHKKQSLRFFQSQKMLQEIFDKNFIQKEYILPYPLFLRAFADNFSRDPLGSFLYIFVYSYLKAVSFFSPKIKETWDTSMSSKKYSIT